MTQHLQYVEIQSEQVLIDSRVYCQDIIQVIHSDWLSDTLQKHQSIVEEEFGAIRFETDAVKIEGQRGVKHLKYALLTEGQCNAFLVLSKNLKKTMAAKIQLVADFEKAKKLLEDNLERQFLQPSYVPTDFNLLKQEQDKNDALDFEVKRLSAQVEKLTATNTQLQSVLSTAKRKLEIAERNNRSGQWASDITEEFTGFTYDADYLFLITGIAHRSYFVAKLFENFKLSEDFIKERYSKKKHGEFALGQDKYFTDAKTALATVINHRSKAGISKRELPAMYHFLFDQVTEGNNTNRRHLRAR